MKKCEQESIKAKLHYEKYGDSFEFQSGTQVVDKVKFRKYWSAMVVTYVALIVYLVLALIAVILLAAQYGDVRSELVSLVVDNCDVANMTLGQCAEYLGDMYGKYS